MTTPGQVRIEGEGAIALAQAREEIEKMENYIDHLEGQLKQSVHEVERGEVGKIKANIRIKNLQFRHQEDMLRKHEEMSMRLRDSEQAVQHHRRSSTLTPTLRGGTAGEANAAGRGESSDPILVRKAHGAEA